MATATQEVQALALKAAAHRLHQAATFAALHATTKPLFRKMARLGSVLVLISFDWPGVLRVYDPKTGELLCESFPGRPSALVRLDR